VGLYIIKKSLISFAAKDQRVLALDDFQLPLSDANTIEFQLEALFYAIKR